MPLSNEDEKLAQEHAYYETLALRFGYEIQTNYTMAEIAPIYDELQKNVGVNIGDQWEPITEMDQTKYIEHLKEICASEVKTPYALCDAANAAALLMVLISRWYITPLPMARQIAINERASGLVEYPPASGILHMQLPQPPRTFSPDIPDMPQNYDLYLDRVYCTGDGPESVVWQIIEVRRRRTGAQFVVIQGEEEEEELLDEGELKARIKSSILIADH